MKLPHQVMPKFKNINYIHFNTVDSTNTWAKQNAQCLDPSKITCITADEQTAGRGRFFRKWISPKGQNIYATLYFCKPTPCMYVANLAQILSLSCCSVLQEKGFFPEIKWPNDLLLQEKKVAGILCETMQLDDLTAIILGFGINVNMSEELLNSIDQPATSLAQISGHNWNIEEVLKLILTQFTIDLELLELNGFSFFKERYEDLLAFRGQEISWNDGITTRKGLCHSITSDGRLNLLLANGEMLSLSSGELKT